MPKVRFRIAENGKIHYFQRESEADRSAHATDYIEMSGRDFAVFKNAGKRYVSHKITDPDTMRNYVRDASTGFFHEFDKSAADQRGARVNDADQASLTDKYRADRLILRSRANRIGSALEPFDVGHYMQAAPGSKMDALSGKAENFGANRDHVVSGESLRRRAKSVGQSEDRAYNRGLAIAIPNKEMHRPHSATYGGRQKSKDKVAGVEKHRVDHDVAQPALAFDRDVTTMLERTRSQNHATVHPALDLTVADNRLKQVGAYRKMFSASAKAYAVDHSQGINPAAPAYDVVHTPKRNQPQKIGTFTIVKSTGSASQGARLVASLIKHLKDTGKAK